MGKRMTIAAGRGTLLVALQAWAVLLMAAAGAHAGDLFVPSPDYPTIQAAVDAARDGDTIVLRTGEFRGSGNLDVEVVSKRITIRGEVPTGSVIVGPGGVSSGQQRALNISGLDTRVTLQDLEIRGCTGAGVGGAVRVHDASVTFERVRFIENETFGDFSGAGGALFLEESDAIVRECVFAGNLAGAFGGAGAGDGQGGAVYVGGGSAVFERCVFEDNRASGNDLAGFGSGGGIRAIEAEITLLECSVASNRTRGGSAFGAGISCRDCTMVLVDTNVERNVALGTDSGSSGGISASGTTVIVGGQIRSNGAGDQADISACCGGFSLGGVASLTNVVITGNRASGAGGDANSAAGRLSGVATVTNCTVVDNTSGDGTSLRISDGASVSVQNLILRDGPGALRIGSGATLAITYSNVEGGFPGPGNIDADPLLDAGFRLRPGSPCIDAGDSTALPADAFDLDGDGDTDEPLPLDGFGVRRAIDDPATIDTGIGFPVVDMGAAEFAPPCPADLDGDGELTLADFAAFQNLFGAGDPRADFDGDGALTIFDFLAYQNAFDLGCP